MKPAPPGVRIPHEAYADQTTVYRFISKEVQAITVEIPHLPGETYPFSICAAHSAEWRIFMANFERHDTTDWDSEQVRRSTQSSEERTASSHRRKRRRKNLGGRALYFICVVSASAILAGVGWLLANDLCAFNKAPKTVVLEVTETDTFSSVATRLKEEELIEYKWFFKLFGAFSHAGDKIEPGVYELNTDMDYRALISAMSTGATSTSTETVTVTIPEGYTVKQIISLLAESGVSTEEALTETAENATFDFSFVDNENLGDLSRLEGYLFPDTYEFYVGEQSSSALTRLLKNFETKMMNDEMKAKVESSGRSLQEIVIIASLIEKETDGTDQANIASVIYNRLADTGSHGTYGMLNIDAALLYGLPEDHTGGLTNEDKEYDSPYNLYKYAGLPPTAIANPGLAALQAAVEPESTNYYYYALGKDGKHHFSTTLEEHNAFLNSGEYGG